jgi:hypothetical protein
LKIKKNLKRYTDPVRHDKLLYYAALGGLLTQICKLNNSSEQAQTSQSRDQPTLNVLSK